MFLPHVPVLLGQSNGIKNREKKKKKSRKKHQNSDRAPFENEL